MTSIDNLLSPKLRRAAYSPKMVLHEHWCPGCGMMHAISVEQPFHNGSRWTYDGNAEAPTFAPSIKITLGPEHVCHYLLRAGVIQYCDDSTHKLTGQSAPLPDIPADQLD